MTAQRRVLGVCADDFGLTQGISKGIAELAAGGRLSAVSCITTSAHWRGCARWLAGCGEGLELGLHFNLTEGQPLSHELARVWPHFPGLSRLIVAAHLGRLPCAAIASEWRAQYGAFEDALQRAPGVIDGHQHVHHLPGVRQTLLAFIEPLPAGVAVRNTGCVLGPGFRLKRWLIEATGGRRLLRDLALRGVAHNPALLGIYDFEQPDYRGLMQGWLREVPNEGALLICHPGAPSPGGQPDAIDKARQREAAYLGSEAFPQDLRDAGVRLSSAPGL